MNKIILDIPLEDVSISVASEDKNKDLMYISFELCHEGVNANGDRFTKENLEYAYKTIINKPINWEHRFHYNVGVVTNSELLERDKKSYIKCSGVIWKFKFPEEANDIKEGYQDASLRISMECYFPDANYVLGDYEKVIPEAEASDDIKDSLGKHYNGLFVSREFIRPFFGGAAITAKPADKDCLLLAVAGERSNSFADEHKVFPMDTKGDILSSLAVLEKISFYDMDSLLQIHDKLLGGLGESESHKDCNLCKIKEGLVLGKDQKKDFQEEQKQEESSSDVVSNETLKECLDGLLAVVAELKAEIKEKISDDNSGDDAGVVDERIAELESQLVQAQADLDDMKKKNEELLKEKLGLERLAKLTSAGIRFSDDQVESKKQILGSMTEDAFSSYFEDLVSLKKEVSKDDEVESFVETTVAALNLGDDEQEEDLRSKFTSLYTK